MEKKILSIILAVSMIFGVAVPVFADNNDNTVDVETESDNDLILVENSESDISCEENIETEENLESWDNPEVNIYKDSTADQPIELAEAGTHSGKCDSGLNWTLDEDGTLTIFGSGDMSFLSMPWINYRNDIRKVIIGENVTNIYYGAFSSCVNLSEVQISSTVTDIGKSAFEDCSSLTNVIIPDSVTQIGDYAFSGCSSLTKITLPDSLTYFGGWAFCDCSSLSDIKIPDSITCITCASFARCSSLLYVTVPSNVTSISDWAFSGCSSLQDITISNSATRIASAVDAFMDCNSLTIHGYSGTQVEAYAEKYNIPFEIFEADISKKTIQLSENSLEYDGQEKKPNVSIKGLTEGIDYTVSYFDNINAGTASVCVEGIGVYSGTNVKNFTIQGKDISRESILLSQYSYVYDGQEKKPNVSIKGLTNGKDYKVTYQDNISSGTAYVCVEGIGNYAGSAKASFAIQGTDISGATVSFQNVVYNGEIQTLHPEVVWNGIVLTEGKDYKVENNTQCNAGTYNCLVTGINIYQGTVASSFTIQPISRKYINVSLKKSTCTYSKTGAVPSIVATFNNMTLKKDTDYTIVCENNKTCGTNTGKVIVTFKGNYTGSATMKFSVVKKAIDTVKLKKTSYYYTGQKINDVIDYVKAGNDTLSKKDYKVTYKGNTTAGKAEVIVQGIGNYKGKIIKTFKIYPKISISKLKIKVGETYQLKIKGSPKVKYASTDKNVATVSNSGVITAQKNGTATIKMGNDGVYTAVKVTISKPYISYKSSKLRQGYQLKLRVYGARSVRWSSSNTSVASVSSTGRVYGKEPGKATIIAKAGVMTFKCKITVLFNPDIAYEKIQDGMTYDQVKTILRGAGCATFLGTYVQGYTWTFKSAKIHVTFMDGKVYSKSYYSI